MIGYGSQEQSRNAGMVGYSSKEQSQVGRLIRALNAPWGRGARVLVGLELIGAALQVVGGTAGAVLVAVGLALLVMGLWGHSVLEVIAPRQAIR